jgi:opacity protein-like surface antigen
MLKPSSSVPSLSLAWTRIPGQLVLGVTLLGALLGLAEPARAQSMFAPYVGFTTGGDTTTNGLTVGFSTAFIEDSDLGVEFDVAHSRTFNDVDFQSSGLTTVMLNFIAAPKVTRQLRPFVIAGIGAIRARGCAADCVREVSRTDFGLDAGGGVMWALDDMFGVRGDVRYFRYAQIHRDLPRLDNGPFDFWRVTFGGVITW